jgi:HK97 family phage portal protein
LSILDYFSKKSELENRIIQLESELEKRGSINDPNLWPSLVQQILSKSGQTVNADTALKSSAVLACVKVLSESIASLPLMLYKRLGDGGKDVADNHSLYFLLHDMPNPDMTSFELREMLVGHVSLRGNAYCFKEMTEGGEVIALWPLHPAFMTVEKKENMIIYRYRDPMTNKERIIPPDFIWHIKGLSSDGITGLAPVSLARESIGLSLSQEDYASAFYHNYGQPGGVLEYPGTMQPDQIERLKEQWMTSHTGSNAFRPAVLSGGLKWVSVGMNNTDAQFLESRNFSIEDICRIFRVPAVLVQHPDKSATYASAEQFFLSFVTHTIRPWAERIEQSISRCLLTKKENKKYFAEFKLDSLVRGDIESRYRAYQLGLQNGFLCVNDIRSLENMNPIPDNEGGNDYFKPLNIGKLNQVNVDKGGGGNADATGKTGGE